MNDFEDWVRELNAFLSNTARVTEEWAEHTLHTTVEVADTFAEELEKQIRPTLERWADEVDQSLEPLETALGDEIERFTDEFIEIVNPVVVPLVGALETWVEAMAAPINSHVDPVVNEHTTCIGCKHYYGQAHGGQMLVCAMYPYGPDAETCPDWESVWGQPPNNE
ncbi:hypothetical protein PN498_04775 [Oscillatoria sp. CS-180]|uniref:hypothetical protein n=1 Tax=Oscillatoria sp. CS-180 TaxID=3021720 RepID=UPI0023304981|nr:hypothetical protein [Oscillatoria sp. CS-180]MDB9525291.1 hypothetical protein [Oscillatoria sp. CS-180]